MSKEQTVIDLKKEIDVLSIAKNQHQADKEQEKKKLDAIKKEISDAEYANELAIKNTEKSVKTEKAARAKLELVLNELDKQDGLLYNAKIEIASKMADAKNIESEIEDLKLDFITKQKALDTKVATYKKDISDLCDKIKGLL